MRSDSTYEKYMEYSTDQKNFGKSEWKTQISGVNYPIYFMYYFYELFQLIYVCNLFIIFFIFFIFFFFFFFFLLLLLLLLLLLFSPSWHHKIYFNKSTYWNLLFTLDISKAKLNAFKLIVYNVSNLSIMVSDPRGHRLAI
jgi:hypothetical protein